MKKLILASAATAVCFGSAALAKKDDPAEDIILTQPMKMGDARLTCDQLIDEAANMEVVLGGSPADGLMDGEHMANIGTGLAQHAALRAGGGVAASAIGQVGGLLGRSSKKKKEEEAMRKAIAEKRWIYMVGLYEGRDCDSQPAAAVAEGAVAPATE
jgi:hypothetical protein